MNDTTFRFKTFAELDKQGRTQAGRADMSRPELGLLDAADFDTDDAMQGFLHPFIYRAERIPSAIWFFDTICVTVRVSPKPTFYT